MGIKHSRPVPPFMRYCSAIIPTMFDDSLSYYEALCALNRFIQTNLVEVINNNATVTQEYIRLTNELKEFVENYFENLDVQEEINNKLDAMAEDGTLQEIIGSYLNATAVWGFDTVSDMKASTNLIAGSFAQTLGYYSKNDGGGALYKIREVTNDDVVDESFIIEITADHQNTLVAELIYGSEINIKTLGCTTDISSDVDNASIINNAIQNKTKNIVIPSGEFIVKSPINVTRDETEIRGLGGSRIEADESTFTGTKVINVTGQYAKMNNLHVHCTSANQTLIALYIDGFNCYVDNAILSGTGEYGLYINKEEARIYNSKIRGFKNGVLIEAPDSYFEDIYIEQNTNNGFIAHIGSIEAHHIHSYYNGNRGFYMSNASHSNFYGLYADKNGGTSFELRNCGSCNFYACWAYYTGRTTSNSYGWQVVECYDTNFMGCKCQADQSGTTKSWLLYNSRSNLYGCTAENTNYQISGDNLNSFYSCAGYLAKLNGIDRSNLLIPLTTLTASTTTSLSIPLGKMPNIQDYNNRDYVAKINLRGVTGTYSDLIVALISVGNNAPTRITQLNGDSHVVLTSPTVSVDANNLGTLSITAQNLDSFNTGASGILETNLTARGGE